MRRKMLVLSWLACSAFAALAQAQQDSFPAFQSLASSALVEVSAGPQALSSKDFSVFIFLSPECPLCQNYSSVIRRLREKFHAQVNFYGIFPGTAYTRADIKSFEEKYQTAVPMYLDSKFRFTSYVQATVTPQVILLAKDGRMLYSGAIDDWMAAPGKKRVKANTHYLEDALEQVLVSRQVTLKRTKAIGCKINDY